MAAVVSVVRIGKSVKVVVGIMAVGGLGKTESISVSVSMPEVEKREGVGETGEMGVKSTLQGQKAKVDGFNVKLGKAEVEIVGGD